MTKQTTQLDITVLAAFGEASGGFDYGDVPEQEQSALERHGQVIRKAVTTAHTATAKAMLEIGRELTLAQERLARHGNGTFIQWCKMVCGCSKSAAYRCIAAYRELKDCPTVGQTCDAAAVTELCKTSCPAEAKREILEQAQQGNRISGRQVREAVRKYAARKQRETVKPEPAEPTDVPIGPADLEQARQDVQDLVRQLQGRSIPDAEIVSILRRCAAELVPAEDKPAEVTAESNGPSATATHIKRPKPEVQTTAEPSGSGPTDTDASPSDEITAVAVADAGADKCHDGLGTQRCCKSTLPVTLEYRGIQYVAKLSGTVALYRRSDARDQGWTHADGTFAEAIRLKWEQREVCHCNVSEAA